MVEVVEEGLERELKLVEEAGCRIEFHPAGAAAVDVVLEADDAVLRDGRVKDGGGAKAGTAALAVEVVEEARRIEEPFIFGAVVVFDVGLPV